MTCSIHIFIHIFLKLAITSLLFYSTQLYSQETDGSVYKFKGVLIDSSTTQPISYYGVKLYINDTLRGYGTTLDDGRFILISTVNFDTNNVNSYEFWGPSGKLLDYSLIEYQDKQVFYITDKRNYPETEIIQWHKFFLSTCPNYLKCHPTQPLDNFIIRKNE
jgi:hypothetical protein